METAKQPRNIVTVAAKIWQLIPDDKHEFKEAIKSFIFGDLAYRAPELLVGKDCWNLFEDIMKRYIPYRSNTNTDWEKRVIEYYTGETEE
jgi:hypothetical protein